MNHKVWPRAYKNSVKSSQEKNDCFVRALTETFDIPYDEAHKLAADKFNRKNRRGTASPYPKFLDLSKEGFMIGKYKVDYIPNWDLEYAGSKTRIGLLEQDKKEKYKITIGMFLRKRPLGRYLMLVRGHAFSVVNGVIIGNSNDGTRLKARIENVIIAETP